MSKIILVVAGRNFQPVEYFNTKRILEDAGHLVLTASNTKGEAVAYGGEKKAKVDMEISEVEPTKGDGLFLIGGSGALENLDNQEMAKILKNWLASGKPYGAICISPRILAKCGVLSGKRATGWDGDGKLAEIFEKNGVIYDKKTTITDGKVITSQGPTTAEEFGRAIASLVV